MTTELSPAWRIEPGAGRDLRMGIIGCGGIMTHHVKGLVADGLLAINGASAHTVKNSPSSAFVC